MSCEARRIRSQLYQLPYYRDAVTVDDIVLQPPQIVRIYQAPANEVVSLDELWPMRRERENSVSTPAIIQAYHRLPGHVNGCVLFVFATMDFQTMTPKVNRFHKSELRDTPVARRPAYCRHMLPRYIALPAKSPVAPVGS